MIMIRMNGKMSTLTSLALVSALALSACATGDGQEEPTDEPTAGAEASAEGAAADAAEDGGEDEEQVEPSDRPTHEAGGPSPRLAVTYDGGVSVIDGATLEVLGDFSAQGFVRVNPAGDGRHVFLAEGDSFRLLDAGTWGEPHGDHNHYYTTDPLLTDIAVDGDTPAHVVAHHGIGVLFFDGTGEYHWFDIADLDAESEIETESAATEGVHHGVAVVMEDGTRFETLEDRSGARVLDAEGEELARAENCPGVHGEAAGPDPIIAVGCEDGALIWDGSEFQKIDGGAEYARSGNLFPAEGSPIFLADYRTDQDVPMTEVALINAETLELTTADIGAAYNFRSLARGPEGEALVLAEDGQLHVIDAETGERIDQVQIMDEWTEPDEWQQPRPAIRVIGDIAYITEPEAQTIHMVDLTSLEIIHSAELDFVPNEIAAADGRPAHGAQEGEHDHGDHDHGDEDHDHDHDHDHDDEDEHDH